MRITAKVNERVNPKACLFFCFDGIENSEYDKNKKSNRPSRFENIFILKLAPPFLSVILISRGETFFIWKSDRNDLYAGQVEKVGLSHRAIQVSVQL